MLVVHYWPASVHFPDLFEGDHGSMPIKCCLYILIATHGRRSAIAMLHAASISCCAPLTLLMNGQVAKSSVNVSNHLTRQYWAHRQWTCMLHVHHR